jgi:hypothetical protein
MKIQDIFSEFILLFIMIASLLAIWLSVKNIQLKDTPKFRYHVEQLSY